MIDGEPPLGQVAQAIDQRLGREVGQEPEPPEVHAQNRDRPVAHPPGRVQHGAVAAQDEARRRPTRPDRSLSAPRSMSVRPSPARCSWPRRSGRPPPARRASCRCPGWPRPVPAGATRERRSCGGTRRRHPRRRESRAIRRRDSRVRGPGGAVNVRHGDRARLG